MPGGVGGQRVKPLPTRLEINQTYKPEVQCTDILYFV